MKIRKNFWSGKSWYTLKGGLWHYEKVKLSTDNTLEIKCRGTDGIIRQGYYKNGRWVETENEK